MVGIAFVASDFKRVMRAIEKVRRAVRIRAQNIGYQMSLDYSNLLIVNILSQKYSSNYAPYHPLYESWKRDQTAENKYWVLMGDLLSEITVWRTRNGWMAGIPSGVTDSGGKNYTRTGPPKYIAAYARIMEYGGVFRGQTHLPRPLFGPTFEEYKRAGAPKRIEESKTIILRNWA